MDVPSYSWFLLDRVVCWMAAAGGIDADATDKVSASASIQLEVSWLLLDDVYVDDDR